jgi:uncharacterized protein (TIGR03067 family)
MTRQLLRMGALVCLLVLPSLTVADQGERTDNSETIVAGQLRGTWVAVSMERKGHKEEAPKNRELTFAFDVAKVLITEGTHKEEWSYQNRDTRTPWEIDLIPMKGQPQPPGLIIKGIYRIDGDTLKLAFRMGGSRPSAFESKDDESGVITFKRKK